MKLNNEAIKQIEQYQKSDVKLPQYDRKAVREATLAHPKWVHFGAGNIFRAFPAAIWQKVLNAGEDHTGIIVGEGYDYELIDKAYKPFDSLSLLVTLKSDGTMENEVIGSVVEALRVEPKFEDEWHTFEQIFENPSLQMVSFTITEKGYSLVDAKGVFYPVVESDFLQGPKAPEYFMGKLTSLCYKRYLKGALPIALVSMDNCSHNGTKLYEAVHTYARKWADRGLVEEGFVTYINNPDLVAFPWSMIDKITPRPDSKVKEELERLNFEETQLIITDKNTYTAAFVNAEEAQYLVIEDCFPNGRPKLELGGVIFTDRETVDKVEKMKVCTCLNPLHTALAVYGCLLGYESICKEVEDPLLLKFIQRLAYDEGIKVVVDPGIIRPEDFIEEVIGVRLPNPFLPDTPQRIATDTSQKLAIRFGETIKAYANHPELKVTDLKLVPLVLAGWCRYLLAVDDAGQRFTLSPDPLLQTVCEYVKEVKVGDEASYVNQLQPILTDERIFGVNLYEVGLGEQVEAYFKELIAGNGAVRRTLEKYI